MTDQEAIAIVEESAMMIDIASEEWKAADRVVFLAKKALLTRCNAGHENSLPAFLWDCPTCTKELQEEIKALNKIFDAVAHWLTTKRDEWKCLEQIKNAFRPLWRKRCGHPDKPKYTKSEDGRVMIGTIPKLEG